jgi:hypothetical protein
MRSRGEKKLHKAKGDHLELVHLDRKVLEMIRQVSLVLVIIEGQEPQNQLKGLLGLSPVRSDGSRYCQMGD